MSATTPSPLLSDSLRALGLDTGTLFFALNYEFTKIEQKGLFKNLKKRFKKNEGAIDIDFDKRKGWGPVELIEVD